MNPFVSRRIDLLSAWSGVAYVALVLIGFAGFAGFVPMHAPTATAEEIASIYKIDSIRIRVGMVVIMLGSACFIPFTCVISEYISRLEGTRRTLTNTFLLSGFATAIFTFYPPMWWAVTAFRPERAPELTHMLNDMAWLWFLGSLWPVMPAYIVCAIVAFCDNRPQPLFPRWFGYLNVWVFIIFLPDQLMFFFYRGPFAWNGLIAIWIPLAAFITWILCTFFCVRQAILKSN